MLIVCEKFNTRQGMNTKLVYDNNNKEASKNGTFARIKGQERYRECHSTIFFHVSHIQDKE